MMKYRRFLMVFLCVFCLILPLNALAASASDAAQMLSETNHYRTQYGLKPLKRSSALDSAASLRAAEIAIQFSHTRPNGSSWHSVSKLALAENIAKGYTRAGKTVAAWMNSSGHRANILRAGYGSVGLAVLRKNGVTYWVQLFGR